MKLKHLRKDKTLDPQEENWFCPKCNNPVRKSEKYETYYCGCVKPGKVQTHVHYSIHLCGELYPPVEFVKEERFLEFGWIKKEGLK